MKFGRLGRKLVQLRDLNYILYLVYPLQLLILQDICASRLLEIMPLIAVLFIFSTDYVICYP